ncbi:hypothetical protein M3I53_35315 [Paraburkholderia sp. CNPSo 3272]|uniref:hypothetical protein n=1 Tax=Paraburkholderia sp. CNPSo 3272 TaxID=2940931 RepID=UPI0020B751D3|nr:hypothetical protein [Paraburkholderia sp. CNPSo 3272]MCP3728320.1 hypothetical protein [Paraburkholderia sp. CNPSo 3272]
MQGTDIFRQRLFRHGFVSLVHSGHPVLTQGVLRKAFESLPHAVVRADGRSLEIIEQFLRSLLCRHHFGGIAIHDAKF